MAISLLSVEGKEDVGEGKREIGEGRKGLSGESPSLSPLSPKTFVWVDDGFGDCRAFPIRVRPPELRRNKNAVRAVKTIAENS